MHIEKVSIKNFRLLENIELSLEEQSTVIVGRNNSGKTSFAELFRRLSSDTSPNFNLEDFSLNIHSKFWDAYNILKKDKKNEENARKVLPFIEVDIVINYKQHTDSFGLLSEFIIDLNPNCTEALIKICYQLNDGKISTFFEDMGLNTFHKEEEQKMEFFRAVKERLPRFYRINLSATDPNDSTNTKIIEWKKFQQLIQGSFINAQRELGDMSNKEKDVLGGILEGMFSSAKSESASENDKNVTEALRKAVSNIQGTIDSDFNNNLKSLLPAFSLFGYPGLPDPELLTETILDVESLLKNHTKIRYTGLNGVHLPESYNGLGTRNLIFILLKVLEFYKEYLTKKTRPLVHLVFIEEPEAHLHPQMQEVFISKLKAIAEIFARQYNNGEKWPVQFIVSTHSSHIANKADFTSIRYFLSNKSELSDRHSTKIKDLRIGSKARLGDNVTFLQQYMTLTRCDLFFADKAILIEGTSERLLLPKMIEKMDGQFPNVTLGNQYISVMEVGGAYAHVFFELIEFLEIKTLIITDLDSVDSSINNKACKVSKGDRTSNSCITNWFNDSYITPISLSKKTPEEKTKRFLRIAYQIPESDAGDKICGRSFEEAFMAANLQLFGLTSIINFHEIEDKVWNDTRNLKKVQFALKHALEETEWNVPKYISEGLLWLADNGGGDVVQSQPIGLAIGLNNIVLAESAATMEESNG